MALWVVRVCAKREAVMVRGSSRIAHIAKEDYKAKGSPPATAGRAGGDGPGRRALNNPEILFCRRLASRPLTTEKKNSHTTCGCCNSYS